MAFLHKIPWTRYPTTPGLNRDSPQTDNLLGFWPLVNDNALSLRDLVGTEHLSSNTTVVEVNPQANALGRAFTDDITTGASALDFADTFGITGNASVSCFCRPESDAAQMYLIGDHPSSGAHYGIQIRTESDNTWTAYFDGSSSNGVWHGGSWAVNTVYHIVCNFDLSGNLQIFVNGVSAGAASISGYTWSSQTGNFAIGSSGANASGANWTGKIWDVRVYRGLLNARQRDDIRLNPYDIYEPQTLIIPINALGGTSDVSYHGSGRGILRGVGRGVG